MTRRRRHYNWPNIVFFVLTPLAAIFGAGWVIKEGGPHLATWITTVIMALGSGLAITGGYHRLYAHRSYQASGPVRFLYLFFGSAAFQGSARWWAMEHRHHHRYVDTELDPYGINKGFWYAHIGWLFTRRAEDEVYDNIKDLDQDPMIRFQHDHYIPLAFLTGFIFPAALAALWGDLWGGLFIAGLARMVLLHHATFLINSLCHYMGKQTYSDKHSARDSWFTALFTYGEGYHNFHHEFQSDYRNGIRAYQWDPTKWLIGFLAWIGLAKNLRRVGWQRILQAKLEMDQKRFARRLSHHSDSVRVRAGQLLSAAKDRLESAQARFLELKQEYRRVKREKIDYVADQLDHLRRELRHARRDFRAAMAQWQSLIKGPVLA